MHTHVDALGRNLLLEWGQTYIGQACQEDYASCIIRHVNVNMSMGMNRYQAVVAASHKRRYVCRT